MEQSNDGSECAICLQPTDDADRVSQLMCGHEFHSACVIQWFQQSKHGQCPTCRRCGGHDAGKDDDLLEQTYCRNRRNYRDRCARLCKRDAEVRETRETVQEALKVVRAAESQQQELQLAFLRDPQVVETRHSVRKARRQLRHWQLVYDKLTESHLGPPPRKFAERLLNLEDA